MSGANPTRWFDIGKAFPAVVDAEDFIADTSFRLEALVHGGFNDPFQGGVQSGTVAAAGKYTDTAFFHSATGIIGSPEACVKASGSSSLEKNLVLFFIKKEEIFTTFIWTFCKKGSRIIKHMKDGA